MMIWRCPTWLLLADLKLKMESDLSAASIICNLTDTAVVAEALALLIENFSNYTNWLFDTPG